MKRLLRLGFCLPLIQLACTGAEGLDAGPEDSGQAVYDGATPRPDLGTTTEEIPPPTLNGVSPRSGSETGGTRVTIRGTAFREPALVYFGDAPATSVVVLDEVSIAASTPPGPVGPVTVKVETAGGIGELPNGFVYHRELRLDRIEPSRIPDEGGVFVTITGKGFDDHTLLYFDRKPLRGLKVIDAEHMEGYAPSLEPGRPEARLMNQGAEVRRSDVLHVYGTPDLAAVAPGYGPTTGGAEQALDGDGLTDATAVRFGGVPGVNLAIASDAQLAVAAPALTEGPHDLLVENVDAQGQMASGYIAYDPARFGFGILGVTPGRASTLGGEIITVVGRGFGPAAQVAIAGRRLALQSWNGHALSVIVPPGLPIGAQDLTVYQGTATLVQAGAVTIYQPVTVESVTPSEGPASGGTTVTIRGQGFTSGAVARIADVPLRDVVVVSDRELTGVTVAGSHGPSDVSVKAGGSFGALPGGFRFIEPFEIVRMEPTEGSMAGNTYVSVFGRGFDGPAAAKFDGTEGLTPFLENGSLMAVRTPPAPTGVVDVELAIGGTTETLLSGYGYYDPRLITGGAWGGPIEGSVNVAVMTFDREPIPGMVVQLGYDADLRYAGITDINGMATISSPEIRGEYTVTVGAPGIEFVTFHEIDARNLSMFASPYPQSMPPDAPVMPCPVPVAAPTIRGRIYRFKSPIDETTRPGWVTEARITYTQSSVFAPNPIEPPEQTAFVYQEGQEYEIVVMRVGTVAVYAISGDLNPETGQFIPRKMGFVRSVPVAPEMATVGIDISLDFPLDQEVEIRLDQPPSQLPGPSINAVFPFLNLGSDGVVPFPPSALAGSGRIIVPNLPAVGESEFIYMGGSFTLNPTTGGLTNPYSLSIVDSAEPFANGIDLGPFLEMPQNMSPKNGTLLEDGRLHWEKSGITPDLMRAIVVDVVGVSGSCCNDTNMNGQCDTGEPIMGGSLPQQFTRWSLFGKGAQASYALPRMPLGVNAFDTPNQYTWALWEAVAPRFDYDEWIYNQFAEPFWRSWSISVYGFAVKEETD